MKPKLDAQGDVFDRTEDAPVPRHVILNVNPGRQACTTTTSHYTLGTSDTTQKFDMMRSGAKCQTTPAVTSPVYAGQK